MGKGGYLQWAESVNHVAISVKMKGKEGDVANTVGISLTPGLFTVEFGFFLKGQYLLLDFLPKTKKPMRRITKEMVKSLTWEIIGASIEVHKVLGPGLLEKVYEAALMRELALRNLAAKRQLQVVVDYKGIPLECDLRCDILVEDTILCELKATKEMHPIFDATLLSYMKLLKKPKGILINFHVYNIFKDGQKTFVNEFFSALPDE